MQIARVVGTVVSTQKNRKLEGAKLLLVQPLTLEGDARGVALLAIDAVGAGVGERVLVVIEGKAAGDALGRKAAAVDAAIIGIVDHVDVTEGERNGSANGPLTRGGERSEPLADGGGGASPQTKK
jgi:microcompartment protein CcmK/EutM